LNRYLLNFFLLLIGLLDTGDQLILETFYNSLVSTGSLVWNFSNDLCGQTGVNCSTGNPQRLRVLYD